MTKVSNLLARNSNIFDAIRLVAAIFVIWSHSYPLTGIAEPIPFRLGVSHGSLGVHIFFIISGLLITASWVSHPRLGAYLGKRALRIVPALVVVIFASVFVLGPLFTNQSLGHYFTSNSTLEYLNGIFIFGIHYNLPGVFLHNPYAGTVNGSLWTLPYEVAAYIMVALFGMSGLLKKKKTIVILFLLCVALTFITNGKNSNHFLFTLNVNAFSYFTAYFLSGVILYLYRDKIILKWHYAAIAALALVLSVPVHKFYLTTFFTLPYLVMYVGSLAWKKLTALSKYGDFSYGMYIFAWPVQQSLVAIKHNNIGHTHLFVYTLVITSVLAILSWYLIEKPMMKLKSRFNKERYPSDTNAW